MLISLHNQATTTPRIRAAIQASSETARLVAEPYGSGDDWRAGRLSDDDILARLFRFNQSRAAAGR